MKESRTLKQPLTDDEFAELDDFLLSDALEGLHPMDVPTLDGFMTALASGPAMMMPNVMLPWIWNMEQGEGQPRFKSEAQGQHIIGLLIRHWTDLNNLLLDAPDAYEPLIMEGEYEGQTLPIIDEWCRGYWLGIERDPAGWAPLLAEHPEWFKVIRLYGTDDGAEALENEDYTVDEQKVFADSLADAARNIHAYWFDQRARQIAKGQKPVVIGAPQPIRREAKVGRNDPCPCGSGKKYKQCHGAADSGATQA